MNVIFLTQTPPPPPPPHQILIRLLFKRIRVQNVRETET